MSCNKQKIKDLKVKNLCVTNLKNKNAVIDNATINKATIDNAAIKTLATSEIILNGVDISCTLTRPAVSTRSSGFVDISGVTGITGPANVNPDVFNALVENAEKNRIELQCRIYEGRCIINDYLKSQGCPDTCPPPEAGTGPTGCYINFVGSISGTELTVVSIQSGELEPDQVILGADVLPDTLIVSQISGQTGSVGVYELSISQNVAETQLQAVFPPIPTCNLKPIPIKTFGAITVPIYTRTPCGATGATGATGSTGTFFDTLNTAIGFNLECNYELVTAKSIDPRVVSVLVQCAYLEPGSESVIINEVFIANKQFTPTLDVLYGENFANTISIPQDILGEAYGVSSLDDKNQGAIQMVVFQEEGICIWTAQGTCKRGVSVLQDGEATETTSNAPVSVQSQVAPSGIQTVDCDGPGKFFPGWECKGIYENSVGQRNCGPTDEFTIPVPDYCVGPGKWVSCFPGNPVTATPGVFPGLIQPCGEFQEECFLSGTKITMADNTKKCIEDVKVGEYVLSYDEIAEKIVSSKVLLAGKNPTNSDHYYVVEFSDHSQINVTDNHPFYLLDKGWASINPEATRQHKTELNIVEMNIGDSVKTSTGYKKIIGWLKVSGEVEVFNVHIVENTHTFFAEDSLVHNKCVAEGSLIDMEDGSFKKVEDVKLGDKVLGGEVLKIYKKEMLEPISGKVLENGQVVTGNHIIKFKGEFVKASETNLKDISINTPVYDLETSSGYYYISGIQGKCGNAKFSC